jgi:hypothetical protein
MSKVEVATSTAWIVCDPAESGASKTSWPAQKDLGTAPEK